VVSGRREREIYTVPFSPPVRSSTAPIYCRADGENVLPPVLLRTSGENSGGENGLCSSGIQIQREVRGFN
jgi:hypothetical protein